MAGKKTFVAGEVLLAQDVNDFLMDQTVMNFASDAARSSAIPTPTEGMVSYRSDINNLELYNGSAWQPASGLSFINETSFSAVPSVSLPNDTFTSVWENYRLLINLSSSAGSGNLNLRLRKAGTDNTASSFIYGGWAVNSLATTATQVGNGSNALSLIRVSNDADNRFSVSLDLFNPKENKKTAFSGTGSGNDAAPEMHVRGGFHNVTDTFDAVTIFHSAGNNIAGKIQVYGYGN
jgi:hypothetical protein